jgi:GNAT superfamily N-acetyltransferase
MSGSDPFRGQAPALPEPVRLLARNPFRELPKPKSIKRFDLPGARMSINSYPGAQTAFPLGDDLDVPVAVEAARAVAREHGKVTIAWWLVPEHAELYGSRFEELGIVNTDTPGFEAIENGLALVEPPAGERVEGVEVRVVETYEQYVAASRVAVECFGLPELPEEEQRARFDEYVDDDAGRLFVGVVEGEVVGTSFAAFAAAGLNLFGGSVLPAARGRGVYRALLAARWDYAVERGTPALTVQAGRQSRPICERLGFRFVDASRVYVDSPVR